MEAYARSIALLNKVSTEKGFLASANDITNYRRVWARDGVICSLAALLDGDEALVQTAKATLVTLAEHQHQLGNIPSNVFFDKPKTLLSFGGLAGRVDTVSWFIIGVCNYAHLTGQTNFAKAHIEHLNKGLSLMEAWEFNTNHLMYVPRSGNWADEYITEGYILYDQLLRVWALRCYHQLFPAQEMEDKIRNIERKVVENYRKKQTTDKPYHPRAYKQLQEKAYWVASFNPSGYQEQFDALANAIGILLDLDDKSSFSSEVISYAEELRASLKLNLLPAFWPPITEEDADWNLLENNCKYEFRNVPFEFHNGGTWQMVNGFYGAALCQHNKTEAAEEVLQQIHQLNEAEDWAFYENFNTDTGEVTGVPHCAWSAAGAVILQQYLNGKKLMI